MSGAAGSWRRAQPLPPPAPSARRQRREPPVARAAAPPQPAPAPARRQPRLFAPLPAAPASLDAAWSAVAGGAEPPAGAAAASGGEDRSLWPALGDAPPQDAPAPQGQGQQGRTDDARPPATGAKASKPRPTAGISLMDALRAPTVRSQRASKQKQRRQTKGEQRATNPNALDTGAQTIVRRRKERVGPKKERISRLKREILRERRELWYQAHPDERPPAASESESEGSAPAAEAVPAAALQIRNWVSAEDVEDEEEYEEVLGDVESDLAELQPTAVAVPRGDAPGVGFVFARFATPEAAAAAHAALDGRSVGGKKLKCREYPEALFDAGDLRATVPEPEAAPSQQKQSALQIRNWVSAEDVEDEEEYEEVLGDVESDLAELQPTAVAVPRGDAPGVGFVFARFATPEAATAAHAALDGRSVGGKKLKCREYPEALFDAGDLRATVPEPEAAPSHQKQSTLQIRNWVSAEDVEDEEEYEEVLGDVESDLAELQPTAVAVPRGDAPGVGFVFARFATPEAAAAAHAALDGRSVGGKKLKCREYPDALFDAGDLRATPPESNPQQQHPQTEVVRFRFWVLEDAMTTVGRCEELIANVEHELRAFEPAEVVVPVPGQAGVGGVWARFDSAAQAKAARTALHGQRRNHSAAVVDARAYPADLFAAGTLHLRPLSAAEEPVRVPKLPTADERTYISHAPDATLDELAVDVVGKLAVFQDRLRMGGDQARYRARKRFVIGLREVHRSASSGRAKCVLVARNVDAAQPLDDTLAQIVQAARSNGVPVAFTLTRRQLAQALGRRTRYSALAVLSADGANAEFKALLARIAAVSSSSAGAGSAGVGSAGVGSAPASASALSAAAPEFVPSWA